MGTEILLKINNLTVDYGKNEYYTSHYWLFRDQDKKMIEYIYANDFKKYQEGYSANLKEIKFRLNHLGYSWNETKMKYEKALKIWNRTHNLNLPFGDFARVVFSIDFKFINDEYLFKIGKWQHGLASYLEYLFKKDSNFKKMNIEDKMEEFDNYYSLEDFLNNFNVYILIRILCEKKINLKYTLDWEYYDLVDNGWASIEDIESFNESEFIIHHNRLYGNLQEIISKKNKSVLKEKFFNEWFVSKGLSNNKIYKRKLSSGQIKCEKKTLPVYVRNIIHHPENLNNKYSLKDLLDSVNFMLSIIEKEKININADA